MTLPISVCIPVRNEQLQLPSCLEALADSFREVVVVDSRSTDRTKEIAVAAGTVVLDFEWNGRFPKKRNWALRNYSFANDWVLFLDADEIVTPQFVSELHKVLPSTKHVGFWIPFTNWFMGQPLHHGDVFRKLALFRRSAGEYEGFPEDGWSHLDMEVHEHPVLSGSVGEIQSRLHHCDDRGLEHYLAKHNAYSTWEARRYQWLLGASPAEWALLTPRQRFKYRNLGTRWLGILYFLYGYIYKRGFLDGVAGFEFARLKYRYFDEIRLKIMEFRKAADGFGCADASPEPGSRLGADNVSDELASSAS